MFKKINGFFLSSLKWISLISIVLLTVVVALQVVTRQLKISLPWTEELARFAMIWLTFAGTTLALEQRRHLSVQYFLNLTKKPTQKVVRGLSQFIVIFFYGVITMYGFKLSKLSFMTKSSTLQWPMGLIYAILPITSLMAIYVLVYKFKESVEGDS